LDSETKAQFDLVETENFDIFAVSASTKNNELLTVTTYLLNKEKIFSALKIKVETYLAFIQKIQSGYNDIAYHNRTHASDVAQTCYFMITTAEYRERA
jgi:hypothetical protein